MNDNAISKLPEWQKAWYELTKQLNARGDGNLDKEGQYAQVEDK